MKTLLMILTMVCSLAANAAIRTVIKTDSANQVKYLYELNDTIIKGKQVTDTLSITTIPLGADVEKTLAQMTPRERAKARRAERDVNENEVAIIGIIMVFGAPALIVLIYFYFRHKRRQAELRVIEQAIAAGQPIPQELLEVKIKGKKDSLASGINTICVGLGLFIFLWALTGEFGLACIGLLVMFTGFGKVIIYYLTKGE